MTFPHRTPRPATWRVVYALVAIVVVASACGGGGDGDEADDGPFDEARFTVRDISDATAIATGTAHSCALRENGTVACWGDDQLGQLGQGGPASRTSPVQYSEIPVPVSGLSHVSAIALGSHHACAVGGDGGVWCWGNLEVPGSFDSDKGGSLFIREPVPVEGVTGATAVAVTSGGDGGGFFRGGEISACGLLDDGTVTCWGNGNLGGLAADDTQDTEPLRAVDGITSATSISAGDGFFCAVVEDGGVWCWGNNSAGQLGDGTTDSSHEPVRVEDIDAATGVAPGGDRTCALLEDGTVSCWGGTLNEFTYDEQHDSPDPPPLPLAPEPLEGITDATAISASGEEYGTGGWCVLLRDGTVSCWESDFTSGAIDLGYATASGTVDNITDATSVSVGSDHACALLEDRTVACWGTRASTLTKAPPVRASVQALPERDRATPIPTPAGVVALAPGSGDSGCFLIDDGSVSCWRDAAGYMLEQGLVDPQEAFPVPGITNATAVSVGIIHSCALLEDGSVSCWGDVPRLVDGIGDATAVSAGLSHSCALLEGGTVSCWGKNDVGQLGNGTTQDSDEPVSVQGISHATAISVDGDFSCAIVEGGAVYCWGTNEYGELRGRYEVDAQTLIDDPTQIDRGPEFSAVPVRVEGIGEASAINTDASTACVLSSDGTVYCWGYTDGIGSSQSDLPIDTGIGNAALALGPSHVCALLQDRTVSCWGANSYSGTLGRDTPVDARGNHVERWSGPGAVEGLHDVVAISARADGTCALIEDGSVSCWGLI
ncbi:MAG: hypothetical protein M5U31_08675 [Acidimicrobiia bacterium]|nr:hypothetical protein [Acidimicrobiia bacterium]